MLDGTVLRASRAQRRPITYERRRPETTTLHRVVRENIESFYAAVEQGFATASLPEFVRRELEAYLDCGLLSRGFALLACDSCEQRRLVAFSCQGRSFCPSCTGRRMAQTGANLVEHVLPPAAPLRQYVLTLPFELRARLAYDAATLGAVCRIFVDSVLGFYRRRMHELDPERPRGKSGAVTAVQRVQADLRINPHFHAVALDGVFAPEPDGTLAFHALPALDTTDVAELLQVVRVRILRYLERSGVIELDDATGLTVLPHDLAEREPALAQLAAASVSGLMPAGPERRNRPPLPFGGTAGVRIDSPLCASEAGFGLHARTTAAADDLAGKEALVRYILRPPIAQERLELLDDGMVRIQLRRPFGDGTTAVDMDPLSLLCRLAASVFAPRFNVVRYSGVLAPASKWRSQVVPPAADCTTDESSDESAGDESVECSTSTDETTARPATHRSGWRPWAELMRRTFAVDVEKCPSCGGRLRLLRLFTDEDSIRSLLTGLGENAEPPARAPARDPPFFQTKQIRRRAGESTQQQLFE